MTFEELSSNEETGHLSALIENRALRLDSSDVYRIFGAQDHDDGKNLVVKLVEITDNNIMSIRVVFSDELIRQTLKGSVHYW